MSEVDSRLLQLQLAIEQRLQMAESRYCLRQQIQQHDIRLLSALKALLQQDVKTGCSPWFHFLQQNASENIALGELVEFIRPAAAWVFLHELKSQLTPQLDIVTLMQCNKEPELVPLYWQLLRKRQLMVEPSKLNTEPSAHLCWYLGCSGQTAWLSWCQQISADEGRDKQTRVMAKLAMHMLGNKQPVLALLQQLVQADLLSTEPLMLLIAAASPAEQQQMVNFLAGNNQLQKFAILAMGYSRAEKYVAFLSDLYVQTEFSDTVITALDYILGFAQTDELLQQLDNTDANQLLTESPVLRLKTHLPSSLPGYVSIAELTLQNCEQQASAKLSYLYDCHAFTLIVPSEHH